MKIRFGLSSMSVLILMSALAFAALAKLGPAALPVLYVIEMFTYGIWKASHTNETGS